MLVNCLYFASNNDYSLNLTQPFLILVDSMCSSRQNPYPPNGRSLEIPRGRGVLKAKILEAKYEAKLEFLGGGRGVQNKRPSVGEYGYFLELHNAQIGIAKISFELINQSS